eukprot:TRINITY_DN14827_c0_g1_i1.p1 TRINITY_DN14827_c0_g1~~TRINITY_DN14827_c0_g1_i1.p1  ORF type:complete len:168 (+),score=36.45 TRINITY_DN14827_c0_g1_i1:112-615(+)
MGLSYDEVEDLRRRYPDRLQTGSKIADYSSYKKFLAKTYAVAAGYGLMFGVFPLSTAMLASSLKKGSHYRASVSIFAPMYRRNTFIFIANIVGGFGLSYLCYSWHTAIEEQAAGVWAVQAAHLGGFKPKGPRFLEKYFPEEDLDRYATLEERKKDLRLWSEDNATKS